jgi:hypothetical protein
MLFPRRWWEIYPPGPVSDHKTPDAGVANQQIRATAEYKYGHFVLPGQGNSGYQFSYTLHSQPHVCRAAQPEGGMSGQRLVPARPVAKNFR